MLCAASGYSYAQKSKPVKILFLLDGSSSMLDDWQPNTPRFTAASRIIVNIVDSIQRVNPYVEFGVRVFGHQYPMSAKNCYDSKLEVSFSAQNIEQIKARLRDLSARGVSPIAWSLQQTADLDFISSDRYAYSIILLTDGGESCGGNVCETVRKLLSGRITFKPYILSLVDYAPLKGEYDCFGKFLTVATPAQVNPAIKTIVDDNRIMFERNDGNLVTTKPNDVIDTPTVTKRGADLINPNAQRRSELEKALIYLKVPTGSQISNIPSKWFNRMEIKSSPIKPPVPRPYVYKRDLPLVNFSKDIEEPLVARSLTPLFNLKRLSRIQRINNLISKPVLKRTRQTPMLAKVDFSKDIEVPVVLQQMPLFSLRKLTKVQRIPNIMVFPEARSSRIKTTLGKVRFAPEEPQTVAVVPKPEKTVVPKEVKPQKNNPPPTPKEDAPITVVKQKSEDTKVLVYFTNGKGKFYKTEPSIDFYDVNAKKVVQSSFRYINKSTGEPEPIKIAPGTYKITKPGTYFKSATVTIEPNTTDKIVVTVSSGSIKFEYRGNKSRPVSEFTALVSNRFESAPVVKQACDSFVEYEPGRYHIEINTLPPTMAYIPELSFMQTHIVEIPEPGTVQITNTNMKGKVQFYYLNGSNFEPFYDMSLNGNPEAQKIEFLPGQYQVYFFKDGSEQMKQFQVKSNKTIAVEL
ncbi:hypothetical protein DBR32_13125 [Taibaiella sp. KBW10]|nr:hypothetical protein DBR32_13125 [Taibaiella sp. KBW10]